MKIELSRLVKQLLYLLPAPILFYLRFLWKHRYPPNIKNPRSLMEKMSWLMLWDENPLRATMADRIKVREFVQEYAPDCEFPKHLWIGDSLTLKVWNELPNDFVIKANHGSHMTYIVNKLNDSFEKIVEISESWLNDDYSSDFGEWVYEKVPHLLTVEERLDTDGQIPPDWKFFCANGNVFVVSLLRGRSKENLYQNLYSRDFIQLNDLSIGNFPQGPDIDEPKHFKNAIRIAEQLSAPFDFIRVDLYLIGDTIYFGEMTCFPAAGLIRIKPRSYDFEFGSKINLDRSFANSTPRPIWKNITNRQTEICHESENVSTNVEDITVHTSHCDQVDSRKR